MPPYFGYYSCLIIAVLVGLVTNAVVPTKTGLESTIIGGNNTELGWFPWQVAIFRNNNESFCSGALIGAEWVLTAAHCVFRPQSFVLALGIVNLQATGELRNVKNVIIHDRYHDNLLANDIALLQMDQPIVFTDYIKAISVNNETLRDGAQVVVSGWGAMSGTGNAPINELKYATLNTITQTNCNIFFGTELGPERVCCLKMVPATGPCQKDGGDPLVINAFSENPQLVGVQSFISSLGCNIDYASGFMRVQPYYDWIQEKTGI